MTKIALPPGTAVYPVPVVLVTCKDKKTGKPNIITIAWCGVVCSAPPLIGISIRPSRYSHRLIAETGDFTVNIPSRKILKQADLCGMVSGSNTDKFKDCSFTPVASGKISSPMIGECPVNIECVLRQTIKLGSHDMFIGEVVAVHADTDIVSEDNSIDYARALPISYIQGEYRAIGDRIGRHGFSLQ